MAGGRFSYESYFTDNCWRKFQFSFISWTEETAAIAGSGAAARHPAPQIPRILARQADAPADGEIKLKSHSFENETLSTFGKKL